MKFENAVELHKLGKLSEAYGIYELYAKNNDANAFHNMSIINIQKKDYYEAEKNAYYSIKYGSNINLYIENFIRILNETDQYLYLERWLLKNNLDKAFKVNYKYKNKTNYENIKKNLEYNKNILTEIKKFTEKSRTGKNIKCLIDEIKRSKYKNIPEIMHINALAYINLKDFLNAIKIYEKILINDQQDFDAHSNLASIFLMAGNQQLADYHLKKAYELNSQNFSVLSNLGSSAKNKGNFIIAEEYYKKAMEINNSNPSLLNNLAACYSNMQLYNEAERLFEKSLFLSPNDPTTLGNFGNMKYALNKFKDALILLTRSLEIKESPETLNNFALLQANTINHKMAIELLDKAIVKFPYYTKAKQNKLYILNYYQNIKPENLFQEYSKYGEALQPLESFKSSLRENNSLKIGFVSGDYNQHPLANFLLPLLEQNSDGKFEVYLYSSNSKNDNITEEYKKLNCFWYDIYMLSDKDAAKLINSHDIDVLIDLSGHTAHNRLEIFRYRPAKKSATWIGYNYTTGLKEIDYFITDIYQVPFSSEKFYSEKVIRLPSTVACFKPDRLKLQQTQSAPYLKNNFITFGSFSRVIRMNDLVISTWSSILSKVPDSKLLINSRGVNDDYLKNIIYKKFAMYNIEKERLILIFGELEAGLNSTDIVLDSFPHNSGTTLYESIYMGCPVITLKNEISLGRLAYSILENIGLSEYAAYSIEDYIEKAVNLANNHDEINWLRNNLRSKLEESDIMNYSKFKYQFLNLVNNILDN